ncbi:MAG: phosphatase PAP2 family protein [Micrococcales bacterium]|nr:phosphatase PAP2 family protein [Micrococcales bacterium]
MTVRRLAPAAVALACFVLLTALVVTGATTSLDTHVAEWATGPATASPGLADVLRWWQEISQPRWGYAAVSLLALGLALVGRLAWAAAVAAIATMVAAWVGVAALKTLLGRTRPEAGEVLAQSHGLSFPSGHSAGVVVATLVLLWLLRGVVSPGALRATAAAAAAFAALTWVDRVMLGQHYPTDVLGGILIGIAWCTAVLVYADRVTGASAAPARGRPRRR